MKKKLLVTLFFLIVSIYVVMSTTLPLRLMLLWPQAHMGFSVFKIEGNLWNGYELSLSKTNSFAKEDEFWIKNLKLSIRNKKLFIEIEKLEYKSLVLKSFWSEADDQKVKQDIAKFLSDNQDSKINFKIKQFIIRPAQNGPLLSCTDVQNQPQLQFKCQLEIQLKGAELAKSSTSLEDKAVLFLSYRPPEEGLVLSIQSSGKNQILDANKFRFEKNRLWFDEKKHLQFNFDGFFLVY